MTSRRTTHEVVDDRVDSTVEIAEPVRDQRKLDGCWAHVDAGVPANRAETERSLGRNLWIGCARIQCTTENSVQFSIGKNIYAYAVRDCTNIQAEDDTGDIEELHT